MTFSILSGITKLRIFGKSPSGAFLRLNKIIWTNLPHTFISFTLMRIYGSFLHTLVSMGANRRQFVGTYFLRNRPQLELMRRLSAEKIKSSPLRIAILGCSNGAELYSVLWTIRSTQRALKVVVQGIDISNEVLRLAQRGVYSIENPELMEEPIFERLTEMEMQKLFDMEGDKAHVKSWLKEGITWRIGDAADPRLAEIVGAQDIVVANNFLCHMNPRDADKCLRNISRLVSQGGYLFVSGIDLNIRTRVACDLGWKPITDLIEDIHDGDPVLRADWPFKWWGLEPFNKKKRDWQLRYASAFQVNLKV